MIQVTVERVGVDPESNQAVVLLSDLTKTTFIPIWVRSLEASAIALPLQGVEPPRPLTSDLVISVVDGLGGQVVMAIITDMRDEVFYATLVLSQEGKEIDIDCRPSDAVAVALRKAAPIFVMEKVVAQAGISAEDSAVQ